MRLTSREHAWTAQGILATAVVGPAGEGCSPGSRGRKRSGICSNLSAD